MFALAWHGWEAVWAWQGWAAVIAIGTGFAALGVFLARGALIQDRRATQLAAAIDLLREYRSSEMREARRKIHHFAYEDGSKLEDLKDGDREAVELVGHYLDNVGLLVEHELLSIGPARAFLGGSALVMWEKLELIIRAERTKGGLRSSYQAHFEDFVAQMDRDKLLRDIAKLRRMPSATTRPGRPSSADR